MSTHGVDRTLFVKLFSSVDADCGYHHCLDSWDFVSEGIQELLIRSKLYSQCQNVSPTPRNKVKWQNEHNDFSSSNLPAEGNISFHTFLIALLILNH